MSAIKRVAGRQILDSRGLPTVEVEVVLSDGTVGRAAVPSGASTGAHEALEMRDKDPKRFGGKGVLKAVAHVDGEIAKALSGMPADVAAADKRLLELDGTPNKSRLGANALLGASMAVARAGAASAKLPLYEHLRRAYELDLKDYLLPAPLLNILNGGVHADNGLEIQEFMVVPGKAPSFAEALRIGAEVYQSLKALLKERGLSTGIGDEGGFAPRVGSHEEALKLVWEAVERAGHAQACFLALDAAASEFYKDGAYRLEGKPRSAEQMAELYAAWADRYPLRSLEDPLAEDDWAGWTALTARLGDRLRVIGDDLFVTNVERLKRGFASNAGNAILIKLNQIGTVSETVSAVRLAQSEGYAAVISHRSGETEDPFIADLAVALNAGAIKTGAPCRSERLAKYNQLLRIEGELKSPVYAGDRAFKLEARR